MTPAQLSRMATLLYGDRWQSSLARDLEINDRTVRRWAQDGAPEWAAEKVMEFCRETVAELQEALKTHKTSCLPRGDEGR
mgnify:CR=1 FL=1